MKIKYEITPSIIEVVRKMKNGATLKYDLSDPRYPSTYLVHDETVESTPNWTLTVLWNNGFLKCDGKCPVSSYKLSMYGKNYLNYEKIRKIIKWIKSQPVLFWGRFLVNIIQFLTIFLILNITGEWRIFWLILLLVCTTYADGYFNAIKKMKN